MDKLAVDIVLLPPDDIMDEVIRLNQSYGPIVDLNKQDRLPHITLLQCVISTEDLEEAKARLSSLAKNIRALKLKASLVTEHNSFYRIADSANIMELHGMIMGAMEDIAGYDAMPGYFFDSQVSEGTVNWVKNFPVNSAFDKFDPHITIAAEQEINEAPPLRFTADRLAMCHLGFYNTCRKILFEAHLP